MLEQRRRRWRSYLEKVRSWVEDLASKLEKHGIIVESIILFGSVARGDYTEDSDLDLIIVSSDWRDKGYIERLSLLYRLWDKPVDANFIALTREELREKTARSITLKDASKYWITVYRRKA